MGDKNRYLDWINCLSKNYYIPWRDDHFISYIRWHLIEHIDFIKNKHIELVRKFNSEL